MWAITKKLSIRTNEADETYPEIEIQATVMMAKLGKITHVQEDRIRETLEDTVADCVKIGEDEDADA